METRSRELNCRKKTTCRTIAESSVSIELMSPMLESPALMNAVESSIRDKIFALREAIGVTVKGKFETIDLAIVALLAEGHLLIQDVPGVGKTTLGQALARSLNCEFHRIQFTSDLLPSDVLGVSVYSPKLNEFEFKPGPIFANIVLA